MCDAQKTKLLVVDDEPIICLACRRVFSRQGFEVEDKTDAREGLRLALEQEYAGILLDIKMPGMDGIQFLEELRKVKPDVPVLIMTGYPSIPNAAAVVRLGAADYVTKPFTPEDITQSVLRMLGAHKSNGDGIPSGSLPATVEPAKNPEPSRFEQSELLFLDEAWVRPEEDGSAAVGAVLARQRYTMVEAVRLPRIGEVVYQGLPLAGVEMADNSLLLIPAAVSGVVVGVNEALNGDPSAIFDDPCGEGWITCVCTTRMDEELARCRPRRVILATKDETFAKRRGEQLASLGCRVETVADGEADWSSFAPKADDPRRTVLLFDADSFGEDGPQSVGRACLASPSMRIVVVASSTSEWEAAYREQRIFYYAVEPFDDGEIVEILNSAFQRQIEPAPPPQRHAAAPEPIGGVRTTNRNGRKVHLLASPAMSCERGGLGWRIMRKLTDRSLPVTATKNTADVSPTNVVKVAGGCDRVMVLTVEDADRLPGALIRDTKAEFGSTAGEKTSRVTTLQVQSDPRSAGFPARDGRYTEALAEHIVREMLSY
ncbi:MAG: response regulator [Pirellulales bacterium]|nr:response regulator [Pirellulales bacterium]